MAIPKDLQFVWLKGTFRDVSEEDGPDLWDWALTYHVMIDADTGGEVDPDKLELLATAKMNNVISGGGFTALGTGMWVTARGATNLLAEVAVEIEEDVNAQPSPVSWILAPQTAILILGRTQSLKHQTRKWIPGINRLFIEDEVPRWRLEGHPASANLRNWCSQQLKPQFYFGVGDGKDVVWDPATQTVRDITQIVVQKWPRTIRARTLSASPIWVDVGL